MFGFTAPNRPLLVRNLLRTLVGFLFLAFLAAVELFAMTDDPAVLFGVAPTLLLVLFAALLLATYKVSKAGPAGPSP